ncbi:mitochondrial carrier [Nadsonia fulvescens var. elongata DSM 6958]|uniref:Mitochondrial carrier n=1 Tax=Nadsonia fulvescens var. elongata DSM 6958 TaxID=857566 RepID=A0A1E3PPX5_9ASCO|nr:mitochondrial carrier [Nadsonia fulvescens var. elongata DSM 6958]
MSMETEIAASLEGSHDDGSSRVIKDVLAGTCGGIAQVLSGQPFDTTKVRLQSAPEGKYTGALDVVKKLMANEGFSGFYKGTLTPLIGVGACVSIQFGVNEFMKRMFTGRNIQAGMADTRLSSGQFYLSGAAAGIANGFLASPIEHIRIRLQTQTSVPLLYNGPIDCIKKMYVGSGFAGIFRGLNPTLIREGHGMGMYFLAFEALVKKDMSRNKIERKEIPGWRLCTYGAAAGYAMWFTCYPIDVIKSKLQTDALSKTSQQYSSAIDCAKKIYTTNGIRGFFRGFLPTILRAAPVNACTFYAFELAIRYMG